jgi:hypothetical protein
MRILISILFWMPLLASARPSVIEFIIPNDGGAGIDLTYRLILHESDKQKDQIQRADKRKVWEQVYVGPVTSIELPADARLTVAEGPRADVAGLLTYGDYKPRQKYATSLRLRSAEHLVVVTDFGAAVVSWPGNVLDVRQLDVELDLITGASVVIFSVKGQFSSSTYMVVNDDFKFPHKILEKFSPDPLGVSMSHGMIYIESLKRKFDPGELAKNAEWMAKRPAVGSVTPSILNPGWLNEPKALDEIFPSPGPVDTLNELIAQLDEREPLASMPNKEDLARQAVRALILREFPRLLSLVKEDPEVRDALIFAIDALTQLWLSQRIQDGDTLRRVVIKRLEAAVENRSKCDLALMTIKGRGAHVDSYFRGKALSALNTLHRRLYRP